MILSTLLIPSLLASEGFCLNVKQNEEYDASSPLLRFDFVKRAKEPELVKRNGYEEYDFVNQVYGYYLNISIGTPAQEVEVELNFADSELQVFKNSVPHCIENNPVSTTTENQQFTRTIVAVVSNPISCSGRSFNTKNSRTYNDKKSDLFGEDISPWYNFNYGLKNVQGNYAKDTVSIGNVTLTDLVLLSSNDSTYGHSSLGLGPTEFEYVNLVHSGTTYPNFLDRLVKDGYINRRIYSLHSNDIRSSEGSIIFGGIDHSKYTGELITVPITKDDRYDSVNDTTIFRLGLTIQGAGLETPSENITFANYETTNYLFSPNEQMSWLPAPVFDQLMIELNATANNITKGRPTPYHHYISCPTNEEAFETKLVFNVAGAAFKVPLYNWISYKDDQNRCFLGLDKGYDLNLGTLGSAFARSFYTVVDLDSLQLSFAPNNYTNGFEDTLDSSGETIKALHEGLTRINSAPDYTRSWRLDDDASSTINTRDVFTLSSVYEASFTYSGNAQETITFKENAVMNGILNGVVTVTTLDSAQAAAAAATNTKGSASGSSKVTGTDTKNAAASDVFGAGVLSIVFGLFSLVLII